MPAAATALHTASLLNAHYYIHHPSLALFPSLFLALISAGKAYSWPYYWKLARLFERGVTPDRHGEIKKALGRFYTLSHLDNLSTKMFTSLISLRQLIYYLRRSFKR